MREKIGENKVFQIINKILKFISWIILIMLLILAGFLIYYVLMAKKAEKAGIDYKPPMALYTIISPSMVPNINVYDVVFNVKVDNASDLNVGDVITFVSSDSYMKGMIITHRIVEKYTTNEGTQFKTKGDANVEADSALVFEENIIGRVLFKIPQLGRVQFFLSKRSGWFIAILIPALAVISYDIFKLFRLLVLKKQLKEKEEENKNKTGIVEEDGEKVLQLNKEPENNDAEKEESIIEPAALNEQPIENNNEISENDLPPIEPQIEPPIMPTEEKTISAEIIQPILPNEENNGNMNTQEEIKTVNNENDFDKVLLEALLKAEKKEVSEEELNKMLDELNDNK